MFRFGYVFALTDDGILKFPFRNAPCVCFCFMVINKKYYYLEVECCKSLRFEPNLRIKIARKEKIRSSLEQNYLELGK